MLKKFFFILFVFSSLPFLHAHVKWFSEFNFSDKPLTLAEIYNTTFISFTCLSMFVISILVYLDKLIEDKNWKKKIDLHLESYKNSSDLIIRIAVGATMLLCWQMDAILAPELDVTGHWIGWIQFGVCFLLLFRQTLAIAGAVILALYIYCTQSFGYVHMLDYVHYLGIAFFLLVTFSKNPKVIAMRLPLLYLFTGFSLCWLALEKIFYPQWTLYILEQNPNLSLGFNLDFFRQGAAFVEFSLGYLLIICLLQRPLAIIITLVFFSTTLVFGKTEIIGHTTIHAILIVFLIEGPGKEYISPVYFHKNFKLRVLFSVLNFLVLLCIITFAYANCANYQYKTAPKEDCHEHKTVEITGKEVSLDIKIHEDSHSGWNIEFQINDFLLAPQNAGKSHIPGEGHIHLYINNRKHARVYSKWYHLPKLDAGVYEIKATLNSNLHDQYVVNGKPITAIYKLNVE